MFTTSSTKDLTKLIFTIKNSYSSMSLGPVAIRIKEKITSTLSPHHLEIVNESAQHRHHQAMQGKENEESHFFLTIVSSQFEGKPMIKRHRMVYDVLNQELEQGLHALRLSTKTPLEVESLRP
ncbi:hypothetical protein HMI54_011272 [Coelomomyces lativittatus]|nr:hypothetical protein HMI54_011272 [Coelomomyces lativittatus]